MNGSANRADFLPMSNEIRGKALQDRMYALGSDESKLARATGKDRQTIRRVFAGTASTTTYEQLERWFDREEAKNNAPTTAANHVVIRMEEGGSLVVEGPVDTPEQRAALEEIARDLIREWRAKPDPKG